MSTQAPAPVAAPTPAPAPAAAAAPAPTPTPAPAPEPTPAPAPAPAPQDMPSAVDAVPATPAPAPAPKPGEEPKPADGAAISDDDFAKAVTLGDGDEFKGVTIDPEIVKTLIPIAKELGLKPDALSKLAQAHTRAIVAENTKRVEAEQAQFRQDFETRRTAAIEAMGPEGLTQVRTALSKYVKPGSFLKNMIDMGLGNDIDFLNMARDFGKLLTPDGATGADAGSGSPKEYNWKDNWDKASV